MSYSPHVWPLAVACIFCLGIGVYVRRYPDVPATRPFVAMMWLGASWTAIYALNISVVHLPARIFLSMCIYIPTRLIPPVSLVLAVTYTGRDRYLTKRNLALLYFLPVLGIVASLTSPFHKLFRYDFRLETEGAVSVLHYTGGPLYWITTVYGNGLVIAALVILLLAFLDKGLQARSTLLLILGLLVPVTVNILFSAGVTPIPGYNFAPMSIVVTTVAYLWALLRHLLFGIAPIARSTVVDNIADLVIVFDTRGHIIDFNAAAKAACGLDKRSIGAKFDSLGTSWATFFHDCTGINLCRDEAAVMVGDEERFFDLTISPIEDYRRRIVGRLFVLHDITERRAAERQIRSLLDEKELLLREVHHRIKNNMSVIASILSLQADSLKETPAYNALQDARSRVMSMMVLYERLYRSSGDGSMSIREYFTTLLDRIVSSVGNSAQVEVRKEIQDFPVAAKTLLPVGIIANELLTNALKHAFVGRDHGVVTFSASLSQDGKRATLLIGDDGVGLPETSERGGSRGFGLQLVEALIEQIKGRLEIRRGNGVRFVMEFDPGNDESMNYTVAT